MIPTDCSSQFRLEDFPSVVSAKCGSSALPVSRPFGVSDNSAADTGRSAAGVSRTTASQDPPVTGNPHRSFGVSEAEQ
jgi:hypothetical protein